MKQKMWKKESRWTIKINAEKMKMWKNRVGGSKEKSLEHQRHDYIEAYCEAMHPWNVTLFGTTYFKGISKCEPNNDKNEVLMKMIPAGKWKCLELKDNTNDRNGCGPKELH